MDQSIERHEVVAIMESLFDLNWKTSEILRLLGYEDEEEEEAE